MNTFAKTVFLTLAAAAAATSSAHTIGGSSALRSQVKESQKEDQCMPNDRPQVQSKTANKSRFRFNFEEIDAVCTDSSNIGYEYGGFDGVKDTDECAEWCVNETPTELQNVIRGFNYDCIDEVCQCLYDEGTLDQNNSGGFDTTNYQTRSRKGRGSITRYEDNNGWYCFKLVGAELTEEGLEFYHMMHSLLNSQKKM